MLSKLTCSDNCVHVGVLKFVRARLFLYFFNKLVVPDKRQKMGVINPVANSFALFMYIPLIICQLIALRN